MNLTVFKQPRVSRRAVPDNTLLHPECPIEQIFRSTDGDVQRQLMQYAWERTIFPEQVLFVADYNGLRVLAPSEAGLKRVADRLRHRFGTRLLVDRPLVRYARGVPVLEPYMTLLVKGPLIHLRRVRNDIMQRRGCIAQVSERGNFVLEAEAPLAALLGYEEWLEELFAEAWESSYVGLWLSRYVPVDDDGPEAA